MARRIIAATDLETERIVAVLVVRCPYVSGCWSVAFSHLDPRSAVLERAVISVVARLSEPIEEGRLDGAGKRRKGESPYDDNDAENREWPSQEYAVRTRSANGPSVTIGS